MEAPTVAGWTLTKYERTKVIGIRAEQLVRGAAPLVAVDNSDASSAPYDPYEVAERELLARRLPFVLVRKMPDGRKVHLRLADMTSSS